MVAISVPPPSCVALARASHSVELAIRRWARADSLGANAVASVDAVRLKNVGLLYRASGLGLPAEEARPKRSAAPLLSA